LLFIQDFLVDPVLTAGLGCIHVGFMGDEIAAMTVVQINSKSGWSRISYMGVVPKFRTLGLGKWVHRYSFVQMKKQGGKLYHGGTVSTNTRMIRLFESHGCAVYRQMEEWIYLTKRGRH
jgi:GNAT superfamily N-acetyltransferase